MYSNLKLNVSQLYNERISTHPKDPKTGRSQSPTPKRFSFHLQVRPFPDHKEFDSRPFRVRKRRLFEADEQRERLSFSERNSN